MKESRIDRLTEQLAEALRSKGWRLACAESCTGGWICKSCTDLAGSSDWFDRGFITYSDAAKTDMLDVEPEVLQEHGAVSATVARQMAQGALRSAGVEAAVAVTGIAGPDGGTAQKPVGTVWFAWAIKGEATSSECRHFRGGRESVRRQTVTHAMLGLLQRLGAASA